MSIVIQRIYEAETHQRGHRVLVDRVWPRGITKERARVDEWLRDLAPSTELRKWFKHDPARWDEFRTRYRAELTVQRKELERLKHIANETTLVLLYGAKDTEHNQAVVLAEVLQRMHSG